MGRFKLEVFPASKKKPSRTERTAEHLKFIVSEPDDRRASLINFCGAGRAVRLFLRSLVLFVHFGTSQNGLLNLMQNPQSITMICGSWKKRLWEAARQNQEHT